jgi:hypothetical protein
MRPTFANDRDRAAGDFCGLTLGELGDAESGMARWLERRRCEFNFDSSVR